ncbi:MAG: protein of unknown function transrane [Marmoricola sp.]|nr:protein of unknown function transrane [Marmoricola sp.]
MTVLLSLLAAACYGLADFIGGVASRRSSVWPVGLLACGGGLVGSIGIALCTSGSPTGTDFAWALLAGFGGGLGTVSLYRGFATGRMGVVAPVSGVGAVLLPLVAGLLGGERPSLLAWLGILIAFPGIWFVSREEASASPGPTGGLLDGVLAGLGFGLSFAALGQVQHSAGYWPLVAMETVAVLSLLAAALFLGGDPRPRTRADLGGLAAGALSCVALVCFLLANAHGLLSVAGVLTALYPAFTVLLAVAALRERVHRTQAFGLAFCAAAVTLVSLG